MESVFKKQPDSAENVFSTESLAETTHLTDQYLDILFNHADLPMIIWNSSFEIYRSNKAFQKLSGYDFTDVKDKKLDILFPSEKVNSSIDSIKSILSNEMPGSIELDIVTKDNNVKTVLWNSTNIFDKDNKKIVATLAQDITSRKRSEERLTSLETRYRRLFESAKDGILILDAETGKIIDVNPFLIELLGYSKIDFIDRELWELGVFKDIAANKEKFLELQMKEYVRYDDLPLETAEGRRIWVEFVSNVYLVNNNRVIQCNIRDITERKKAEGALVSSENSLKTLIQAIPDLIWLKDGDGIYISCNPMFERFFGATEEQIKGKTDYDFVDREQADAFRENDNKALLAGKPTRNEELVTFAEDGHRVYLETIKAPMYDSQKKLIGILGIGRDISERKLAESDLIRAKEKAQESDRLKSAFLANMSHEIRTPMNGILGFTGLLKESNLSGDKQQEYIGIIEKSGARLLDIINDIIDISKVEAGITEINITDTNINEQIEYIYNFFKPLAEEKGLKISCTGMLSESDALIRTDKEKIYAVLTNLINNAIKFTNTGTVKFGCINKGNWLEFFVSDTGIGVPDSQKELIFERFRQGTESLSRNYEGTGLGLAITKAYVELLGGRIIFKNNQGKNNNRDSRSGKGVTFTFTIPYDRVDVSNVKEPTDISDSSEQNQITNLKVLIAEDDHWSQELITIFLKPFAKKILKVSTGSEAVEACRKNPDIDLIIMDTKMPVMDGNEATREIRKFNKTVIIFAQTAFCFKDDQTTTLAAGCNDYISKPISQTAFNLMIDKHFDSRK
ncbi:MAG: PAS domain S-box protein [Bacteroidales bacterium]